MVQSSIENGRAPLIVTQSPYKTELARFAKFDTLDERDQRVGRVLSATDAAEAAQQARFALEVQRSRGSRPPFVFPDQYGHPNDRFLAQIARAKSDGTLGSTRLHLAASLIQPGEYEGKLPPFATNDSGWTFRNPLAHNFKEVYGKIGSKPEDIETAAERIVTMHAYAGAPSQLRSEAATVILNDAQSAVLMYSTLALGNMEYTPDLKDRLIRIMTRNPGVSAGLPFHDVIESGITDLQNMYYIVRLAGVKEGSQWFPVEPTIVMEQKGNTRIVNMIARGEIKRLHAWANGLSRGVSMQSLMRTVAPGIDVNQMTGFAQLRSTT